MEGSQADHARQKHSHLVIDRPAEHPCRMPIRGICPERFLTNDSSYHGEVPTQKCPLDMHVRDSDSSETIQKKFHEKTANSFTRVEPLSRGGAWGSTAEGQRDNPYREVPAAPRYHRTVRVIRALRLNHFRVTRSSRAARRISSGGASSPPPCARSPLPPPRPPNLEVSEVRAS